MGKAKQTQEVTITHRVVEQIEVSKVFESPFEPQKRRRQTFNQSDIELLGDSILQVGLEQPILVRPVKNSLGPVGTYEIVFGERRWLAHKAKKIKTIDCFVKELTDSEVIERQYKENSERHNNDPLVDAFYFKYLQEDQGYDIKKIAERLNKSKKEVTEKNRLNFLIPEAIQQFSDGFLPLKHAYYLAKFSEENQKTIIDEGWAYEYGSPENGAISYNEFKEEVERNILRKLASAPFNPDNPNLHLKGLICSNCPERTGFSPMLFEGADNWENDSCLNAKCFQEKTNVNLRQKREEIAAPLTKQIPISIDEAVKKVPLVTEKHYVYDEIPYNEKEILKGQKLYQKPECDSSVASLSVAGVMQGQQVFICQDDNCKVHHPIEPEQPKSKWELERLEDNFNREVSNQLRQKVFSEALKTFNGNTLLWEFADLVQLLTASYLFSEIYNYNHIKPYLQKFLPEVPKSCQNLEMTMVWIKTLSPQQLSQILFLLIFIKDLEAGHYYKFTAEKNAVIQEVTKDYTNFNFRLIDAEIRVTNAPEEFKQICQDYLEKVQSGIDCEPPKLWIKEDSNADSN